MRLRRKQIGTILVIAATAAVSLLLVILPTEKLVTAVGAENAYLFMYVIAFLGSITTFASIPYPLMLLGLAAGGMNPLLIGLASALGVITADSCTFFLVRRGRSYMSPAIKDSIEALAGYIERYPKLVTPGLVLYGTVSPLSNDFAVMSLSLMNYSYARVVLPLACGNILYSIGIAYLGVFAYDWIVGLI
jgi:uncharacterized membrane protein YdjX (TVP38/TMEM64 family)